MHIKQNPKVPPKPQNPFLFEKNKKLNLNIENESAAGARDISGKRLP